MARAGDKDYKVKRFGRIGVLAGGPSSEREISLKSGEAVFEALQDCGFKPVFIDISERIEEDIKKQRIDIAFIALHGGFGEDGTVQKILGDLKIPYTGSGPEASRLALDKLASRMIFQNLGIDVPKYMVHKKGVEIKIDDLNMPLVIKPQREGSSVGLSLVFDPEEMNKALDKAFSYGDTILIEEFIRGREITVGIIDDEPLPVIEIVPEGGCYDYYAKYKSPNTRYLVPAPIKRSDFKRAQDIGLKAHKALKCRSFSRVDMILGGDEKIYVLEVNTIPGLTSRSLLPKAAEAAGISFSKLCEKILEGALKDEKL